MTDVTNAAGSVSARLAPSEHSNGQDSEKPSTVDLRLCRQDARAPSTAAPLSSPPKHPVCHYQAKLKYDPRRQHQNTINDLKTATRDHYIAQSINKLTGSDTRSLTTRYQDHRLGAAAPQGLAHQSRREAGMKGRAPAATKLQRSMLLRQKTDVREQLLQIRTALDPTPRQIESGDGQTRPETPREMANRVANAADRLKFAIRDLLIIAHAQRDEILAHRDADLIDPKQEAGRLKSLETAISELDALDTKLHGVDAAIDPHRQKLNALDTAMRGEIAQRDATRAAYKTHTEKRMKALMVSGVSPREYRDDSHARALAAKFNGHNETLQKLAAERQEAASALAEALPGAPQGALARKADDPRALFGGIETIARQLATAWSDEPPYLAELHLRDATAKPEMTSDQRYEGLSALFDTASAVRRLRDPAQKLSTGQTAALNRRLFGLYKPGSGKITDMQAIFSIAEQHDMAGELEVRARGQLETHVDKLKGKLAKYGIPNLDIGKRTPFQQGLSELSKLSQSITTRRHVDDIVRKRQDLGHKAGREQAAIDTFETKRRTLISERATAAPDKRSALDTKILECDDAIAARRENMRKLDVSLRQLEGEATGLEEAARKAGVDIDHLPTHGALLQEFDAKARALSETMSAALATYGKGLFGRARRQRAAELKAIMTDVLKLSEAQIGTGGPMPALADSRFGGQIRLTRAEVDATLAALKEEARAEDFLRGKNLGFGQHLKRLGKKLFGRLDKAIPELKAGKAVSKGVGSSLEALMHGKMHLSEIGGEEKALEHIERAAIGASGLESALGLVGAVTDVVGDAVKIGDKAEKATLGRQYVLNYQQALLEQDDPERRAQQKIDTRATLFFGQQLQDQEIGEDVVKIGSGTVAGLRYAFDLTRIPFKEQIEATAKMTQAASAVSAGAATLASVSDMILAGVAAGHAYFDAKEIESGAIKHREAFKALCETNDIGLDLDPSRQVDINAARLAITKKSGLAPEIRTRLDAELTSLAETESICDVLNDAVDGTGKAVYLLEKMMKSAGYGTAFGLAVTGTVGGVLLVAGAAGATAAVGAGVYFTYKQVRKAKQEYRAERATDAMMGVADPAVVKQLAKVARQRDLSADKMALNLIAKQDPMIMARQLRDQLRYEALELRLPEMLSGRKDMQRQVFELEDRLEEVRTALRRRGIDPEMPIPDDITRNDPLIALNALDVQLQLKRASLQGLETALADAVVEGSSTARLLNSAQGLDPRTILAIVEANPNADPDVDEQCAGLIASTITARK